VKTDETTRAWLARAHSSNTIATLWKDDLMKLLEQMGTLRRDLGKTQREKVFVCSGFISQVVVVIIR
jgi:hypothetical protein